MMGFAAVVADEGIEGNAAERKFEAWQILMPYIKAGVAGWHDLHEALTPDEHQRIEALIRQEQ